MSLRSKSNKDIVGYFLVLPTLLLLAIFSFAPILQSVRYAFFDYQLIDQQKNDMYLSPHYNIDLANENVTYINIFLNDELNNEALTTEQKATLTVEINSILRQINDDYYSIRGQLSNDEEVVKVSDELLKTIKTFNLNTQNAISALYDQDYPFQKKEDVKAIAENLSVSVITSNFVGLDNFREALTDKRMFTSLWITLKFTVVSVAFEFVLGLALAMIMNKAIRGKSLIRTLSLIPWAIPTSVAALMWLYLYNGDSGIISIVLSKLHIIDKPSVLLGNGSNALRSVIVADIWKTTPYMALLLLAGLQTIPKNLYESSSIDGANKVQQLYKITLPLLKPSILVALLFRTLDAFRVFDLIFVLTGGGPGGQTESISMYGYKLLKAQTNYGYGSTLVILMAIIVGIISFIYIKVLGVKIAGDE
ncbi:carbohydrate ABC transporter permease [Haloplasma contractile]|uniref:ABC transporter permease protein MalFG family protein n=1 Tax=Haloplasma contractile SSD-17B TaxID=1033810 RepID=F7PVB3_9MOLU|nr:sugar ABC transporter permease [Haloplasma contractile]ERJ12922.1 ABC transporter permease protein MalFG family protein [Haloplasma contractile SSD-17B]